MHTVRITLLTAQCSLVRFTLWSSTFYSITLCTPMHMLPLHICSEPYLTQHRHVKVFYPTFILNTQH